MKAGLPLITLLLPHRAHQYKHVVYALQIFFCVHNSHLIKNAAIKLIEIFVCCLLIQFAVTDFQTLILPGIPGIDPAWSQCIIFSNAVGPDLLM